MIFHQLSLWGCWYVSQAGAASFITILFIVIQFLYAFLGFLYYVNTLEGTISIFWTLSFNYVEIVCCNVNLMNCRSVWYNTVKL